MNATSAPVERRRTPRSATGMREDRLANWLALIALLALGIVWQ
jgi:hypothetical protein